MDTTFERSVYKWQTQLEIKDQRIIALDSHDNVLALGDRRGYVYTYEEQVDRGAIGSQSTYMPLNKETRRGQGEII